jgi:hypothetical protein
MMYEILSADNHEDLEKKVQSRLNDSWTITGGISSVGNVEHGFTFQQAMIRGEASAGSDKIWVVSKTPAWTGCQYVHCVYPARCRRRMNTQVEVSLSKDGPFHRYAWESVNYAFFDKESEAREYAVALQTDWVRIMKQKLKTAEEGLQTLLNHEEV